jgi:hypothetical protein
MHVFAKLINSSLPVSSITFMGCDGKSRAAIDSDSVDVF